MRRLRSFGAPGLDAGTVVYPACSDFGPRRQAWWQLVHVHTGGAVMTVDGAETAVPAGWAALSRPGHTDRFVWARDRETRHSWMSLAPGLLPAGLRRELARAPDRLPLSEAHGRLVDALLALPPLEGREAEAVLPALGVAMFRLYTTEGRARPGPALPGPVQRAQRHARDRLGEPLALSDLARAAHVAPEHLVRLFRRHVQRTPMAWLWDRRTEEGVRLLSTSGLPVGRIADQFGFATPFHFSERVRRATGAPPREVRRRAWGRKD